MRTISPAHANWRTPPALISSFSGEGGIDWEYGFPANRLHDGDIVTVGNIRVQARHTPGHTPEHLVFLVTDGVR